MAATVDKPSNYSGIPQARFVDDVDSFMAEPGHDNIEQVMRMLDEQYSKYRFMLTNLTARKGKLAIQIPDLSKSIEMVQELKTLKELNKDTETQFVLSDQVFMKAAIPPTETVFLWLGANVMLEYPLEEAAVFLKDNEKTAKDCLEKVLHDLDYLRDQLTTMEVNMARVYNWDIRRRQIEAANTVSAK